MVFTLYIDQSIGVDNGVDESEFRNIQMCIVFPNIKIAHLHTPFFANVDKVNVDELKALFRKNKRKFFHKRKKHWKAKIQFEGWFWRGGCYWVTALPVLLYYIYDRKTDEQLACREFLSKDMIVPALDWLHQTEGPNGIRTCHSVGMSRLTCLFNERFNFDENTAITRGVLYLTPTKWKPNSHQTKSSVLWNCWIPNSTENHTPWKSCSLS